MHSANQCFARNLLLAIFLTGAPCTLLSAQDADPPAQKPADAYTLHVYANRIQLPSLVIDPAGQQVHSLTREKFDITLDGGQSFHPSAARIEGDDPITLALLLDVSGKGKDILKNLPTDFAALAPDTLHPMDHVSIYAVDCHVIRSLDDVPADPTVLKFGIEKALTAPGLHGERNEPSCGNSNHLWDAVATAANAVSTKPGRRVILVVSPGLEFSSKYSDDQVAAYAADNGIAIFGMRDREENFFRHAQPFPNVHNGGLEETINFNVSPEDRLERICRETGGVVLNIAHTRLPQHLQEFIRILKSRYVIEYPRPDEPRAGKHAISVSVPGSSYLVLPTGSSTPLPDPSLASDPNTVPSAPSQATFGNKRPSQPKK